MVWLRSLAGNSEKICLIGHNAKKFDAWILVWNLEKFKIPYSDLISGFVDSMLVSQAIFPKGPHSKQSMVDRLNITRAGEGHDAVEDSKDIQSICQS